MRWEFYNPNHNPNPSLAYKECDGSGEDYSCSNGQVPLPSPRDHLLYVGQKMGHLACPAR